MFNLFNKKPTDVKGVRSAIIQFIKEELKKNEGGEGGNIKSILIYVVCNPSETHIYRAALFADEPEKFKKEEVQRIADDFDINLPANWKLEMIFDEPLPKGVVTQELLDIGLQIVTNKTIVEKKTVEAYLRSLNGETEKIIYKITSEPGKINIGRETKSQAADGFFRTNHIAFVNSENNPENRSVSRQHAHIEWNENTNSFYLFADEGGIPPHNKMKVRSENGVIERIQTVELGHKLKEGDQIILGEAAVLEFSYKKNEN